MKQVKISVLGAGIAGVATAIGLKKLGFDVTIFYKNRSFIAYEGFSEKTKDGLYMSGCKVAASLLTSQSLRNANWGDKQNSVNYEFVVSRAKLDEALIKDAQSYDIKCIESKVIGKMHITKDDKVKILYKNGENKIEEISDYVVDTRGRFTPYKDEYITGPKSFSLLQKLEINGSEPRTSIDSVQDGWIWQAYIGDKKGYIQITCDEKIANSVTTFEDIIKLLKIQSLDLWALKNYKIIGKLVKRDSYCKIHKTIITDKYILVGDSASSIDPLSGNGAFQALSMSSIASYVVNTIFNLPKNKEIAKKFYKKRVNFIFSKFSNIGRDFYNFETRYKTNFWEKRQNWPIENNQIEQLPRVQNEAILKDQFIHEHEVVITKDNPMGVWLVNNIDVVDLAKYCLNNSKKNVIKYIENFCNKKGLIEKDSISLKNWIVTQGFIFSD